MGSNIVNFLLFLLHIRFSQVHGSDPVADTHLKTMTETQNEKNESSTWLQRSYRSMFGVQFLPPGSRHVFLFVILPFQRFPEGV